MDGETLAKGWIWVFTAVGAFFAVRGAWRRRRRGDGSRSRLEGPPG